MRTDNLAIVFVDIAGFTARTASQTREENEQMLHRFADAVKPVTRVYRGKVVKNIGDAYLLTFRSPTDALLSATAIIDRLAELNAGIPEDDRFDVRAAVNVGDVRVERGDVFGEAVNIAARIEGEAATGEVYFSEAVYLAMTRSEVPSQELGLFELKGITEKVRLYKIPRSGSDGGYSLTAPTDADAGAKTALDKHPLVAESLPFAGLGLSPVRGKLGTAAVIPSMDGAGRGLRRAAALSAEGFAKWKVEIKRSRRWQVATALIAVVVVGLLIWGVWPKAEVKPLTPWQKLQRGLGL